MQKKPKTKIRNKNDDDMLPEYRFDYSKAKPNRFAAKMSGDVIVVVLDDDVAQVFKTAEAVNRALRAIIEAMPSQTPRKRVRRAAAQV